MLVECYFEDIIQNWKKEKFEDNKEVTRIRKSKNTRQYNCQKKRDKRTNKDLLNITQKIKRIQIQLSEMI